PPHGGRRPHGPDRALCRREPESIDQLRLLVRAQEEVDGREPPAQPVTFGLADRTARHHDAQPWVRRLQSREVALPTDDLLLSALADRAGIDDDEVGSLERRCFLTPDGKQSTGHLLAVATVHLAAERPDVESRERCRFRSVLAQPIVEWRVRR